MAGKKDIVEEALALIAKALQSENEIKNVKVGSSALQFRKTPEGTVELYSLRTPQSQRGKGSARSAMEHFLSQADALNLPVKLDASPLDKKTDTQKLVNFYNSLGFEQTGRSNNYVGDPEMMRQPVNKITDKANGGSIREGYGPGGWVDDVVRMAGKVISGEGEEAAKTGIRAYQGSPHNFAAERLVRFPEGRTEYIVGQPDVLPDVPEGAEVLQDFPLGRMRMDKIGTGEGAQAYGHGLYAAENERVAKGYRDALTPKNYLLNAPEPEIAAKHGQDVLDMLHYHGGDPNDLQETINRLKEQNKRDLLDLGLSDVSQVKPQNDWGIEANVVNRADRINRLQRLLASPDVKVNPGHMYEVNIAANPEQFLDWDKPLSEQPEFLDRLATSKSKYARELLALPDLKSPTRNVYGTDIGPMTGQDAFKNLAIATTGRVTGGPKTTDLLNKAGVPGIKYLDAGSRGAGEGTRNYVVFDDKLISIIRKYGIAGASAMLGYNLMEQLDPKQALAASMADQDYQASRPQRSMGGNNSISGALNVARGLNGVK